ncbi:unnamed protein product [Urochloa humidicola]
MSSTQGSWHVQEMGWLCPECKDDEYTATASNQNSTMSTAGWPPPSRVSHTRDSPNLSSEYSLKFDMDDSNHVFLEMSSRLGCW